MRYRATHGLARAQVLAGVVFIIVGVLVAAAAFVVPIPRWDALPRNDALLMRAGVASLVLLVTLVLSVPLILLGQLVQIFLDIRRALIRIDRRGIRRRSRERDEGGLAERLRRRF
jgi:hypothetical protein